MLRFLGIFLISCCVASYAELPSPKFAASSDPFQGESGLLSYSKVLIHLRKAMLSVDAKTNAKMQERKAHKRLLKERSVRYKRLKILGRSIRKAEKKAQKSPKENSKLLAMQQEEAKLRAEIQQLNERIDTEIIDQDACLYSRELKTLLQNEADPKLQHLAQGMLVDSMMYRNGEDLSGALLVDLEHRRILVAFIGSHSNRDWINNLSMAQFKRVRLGGLDINCHKGIYKMWNDSMNTMAHRLQQLLAKHPDFIIVNIGHSMGGALAVLTSLMFSSNDGPFGIRDTYTVSFAAPPFLCQNSAAAILKHLSPKRLQRYVIEGDPIPSYSFGFFHAGEKIELPVSFLTRRAKKGINPLYSPSHFMAGFYQIFSKGFFGVSD